MRVVKNIVTYIGIGIRAGPVIDQEATLCDGHDGVTVRVVDPGREPQQGQPAPIAKASHLAVLLDHQQRPGGKTQGNKAAGRAVTRIGPRHQLRLSPLQAPDGGVQGGFLLTYGTIESRHLLGTCLSLSLDRLPCGGGLFLQSGVQRSKIFIDFPSQEIIFQCPGVEIVILGLIS